MDIDGGRLMSTEVNGCRRRTMAANGDPASRVGTDDASEADAPGALALPWPALNASANGSALLIEGGAGSPGSFRAAHDFMHAKCAIFDAVFRERRNPQRVVHPTPHSSLWDVG